MDSLRPLRIHSNAVFLEPISRVVVRIGAGANAIPRAERAIQVTRWLTDIGFPTVKPLARVPQPMVLSGPDGHDAAVTFWQFVNVDNRAATGAELGGLLRWLHSLPDPPFAVAGFRPLDRLVGAVETSEWLPEPDRLWLLERATYLQTELDSLVPLVGRSGLVHGDAQLDNVLPEIDGVPLLADWDGVATAPQLWDLVPSAVEQRFGGQVELLEEVLAAYGADPTGGPGWQVLCEIYELRSVAAHIRRAPESVPHLAEARLRIASLRSGDRSVRWSAVG